jgi:hypothetical protein
LASSSNGSDENRSDRIVGFATVLTEYGFPELEPLRDRRPVPPAESTAEAVDVNDSPESPRPGNDPLDGMRWDAEERVNDCT